MLHALWLACYISCQQRQEFSSTSWLAPGDFEYATEVSILQLLWQWAIMFSALQKRKLWTGLPRAGKYEKTQGGKREGMPLIGEYMQTAGSLTMPSVKCCTSAGETLSTKTGWANKALRAVLWRRTRGIKSQREPAVCSCILEGLGCIRRELASRDRDVMTSLLWKQAEEFVLFSTDNWRTQENFFLCPSST